MRSTTALLSSLLLAAAVPALADSPTTSTPTTSSSTSSTTTSGTILVTATALPLIVAETEPCALVCYAQACQDSVCDPSDFACVCGNPNSLVVKFGLCTGTACDGAAQFDSGAWIAQLCSVYSAGVGADVVSSASSLLQAEIAAATAATASATETETGMAETTATSAASAASSSSSSSSTATSSASANRYLPPLLVAAALLFL